jgi:hypothetical protein
MKFATDRPFADPEKAARRILELIQNRNYIEKINEPFLFRDRGSPPSTVPADIKLAIERAAG